MKKLSVIFAAFMIMFLAVGTNDAQAQQRANVGQLVTGLLNVNVGAVQVDVSLDNVLNNFTLVDVDNVLNNNNVEFLNNSINNNSILSDNSNFLNNLLQNANILTENQVVVGVLGGTQLVIQNL